MTTAIDVAADQSADPKSRRNLLAAAVGGVGAWIASGLGRVAPVRAEGETMVVGGEYPNATSRTFLRNQANANTVLQVETASSGRAFQGICAGPGIAIQGTAGSSGVGVSGSTTTGTGVRGAASQAAGIGVDGFSKIGVRGQSSNGTGGVGVRGEWTYAGAPLSVPGTGVLGWSGGETAQTPPSAKPKTGVYGEGNQDATSRGVWGKSNSGNAVHGESISGYALFANGRAGFSSSGKVSFATGWASTTISIAGLNSASIVLATIQGNVSGTWVRGVSIDTGAGNFTIRLNKAAPAALTVGWFVLN